MDSRTVGRAGRWLALNGLLLTTLLPSLATGVLAQDRPPVRPPTRPAPLPRGPAAPLTIYLMTMGPGKRVWERFGHNAIWVHDPVRGTDRAYNYGLFDLRQENFLLRFLQGRMWYWMQGFPAHAYVRLYRKANRSVWIQELDLPLEARRELQEFLEWNERPENRYYQYDYYRDNCSTRIRDALDRALKGRLRETTGNLPTGTTYRFHTRRLTVNDPLVYTGLLLALGQPADRPISAWEEMFLPLSLREHVRRVRLPAEAGGRPLVKAERTLYESTDVPPPSRPPLRLPAYLGAGVLIGAAALGLGRSGRSSRPARAMFAVMMWTWAAVVTTAGLILGGLWALTDHAAAFRNENVLQATLPAIPLVWLAARALGNPRPERATLYLALVMSGISLMGLLLKVLPGFFQVNGEIIALALPVHLGVAGAILLLSRR